MDPVTGELLEVEDDDLVAASVFLATAWTRSHRPAYITREGAPALPLHAYATVGFADDRFWTTGARVEPDQRQDPWRFDLEAVKRGTFSALDRPAMQPVVPSKSWHAWNRVARSSSRRIPGEPASSTGCPAMEREQGEFGFEG